VAAALEGGGEECIGHGDGGFLVGDFSGQAEDVRVVMLTGDGRFFHAADIRGADVAVAVRGDAHADAGGAGEDAEIEGTVRHVAGDEVGVGRIIDRFVALGAEVGDLMADLLKVGNDCVFQIDGAVVGTDGNAEGRMAHGDGAGFKSGIGRLQTANFISLWDGGAAASAGEIGTLSRRSRKWMLLAMKRLFITLFVISGWTAAGWVLWRCGKPMDPEKPAAEASGLVSDPPTSPVAAVFEAWRAKPELGSASVGLVLLDAGGGVAYSSALGETALCPASALKTLTTGAALGMLGPEFRFETRLVHRADGNLALVGSGDPTLALADLHQLAAEAVKGGLKEVTGDLVADASVFTAPPVNDHWNWGDIGNAYGAGAFGINLGHNRLSVRFLPGKNPGDPAKFLDGAPVPADTRWEHNVITGAAGSGDGVLIYSSPGGRVISVRGTVPPGAEFAVGGANPDPPAVAVEVLKAALMKAGVAFSGKPVRRKGEAVVLATHRSAALPEIIDHLHRVSDNLEAQCLFLAIGNHAKMNPSAAVLEFWEKQGVAFKGLRLIDGSGLARANMIRPLDLARVNFAARHGAHGERYFQSLNSSLGGEVRAKLGSMSGVKTDVGFLRLENGKELTFALMANGLDPALSFWPLRAELLESIRQAEE
jgi:serine-type D-Ala-D-Ala carboxypeptidase/endopeptidase (penicillin-binding protein 4)